MLALFGPAWNIALISGVLPFLLLSLIGLHQRLSTWLVTPPWPWLLTLFLFTARLLLYLFSTAVTLSLLWQTGCLYSTSNDPAMFHTSGTICPQLLCGTLQCKNQSVQWWFFLFYFLSMELSPIFCLFQLPSTFLPSKGRSITTLFTIWHDFFLLLMHITIPFHLFACLLVCLFRYFCRFYYYFTFTSSSFS